MKAIIRHFRKVSHSASTAFGQMVKSNGLVFTLFQERGFPLPAAALKCVIHIFLSIGRK